MGGGGRESKTILKFLSDFFLFAFLFFIFIRVLLFGCLSFTFCPSYSIFLRFASICIYLIKLFFLSVRFYRTQLVPYIIRIHCSFSFDSISFFSFWLLSIAVRERSRECWKAFENEMYEQFHFKEENLN